MSLKNASGFRRMIAGLCLLVAPVCLLVAAIVDPSEGDDDKYVQSLRDNPDAVQLSTALWIVGFALMVGGVVGVVHVIRRRGVVLANLGGLLAVFGLIMFTALVTTTIAELNEAENLGVAITDRLSDDIEDYWVVFLVFVPAILGTFIGFILLAAAMLRSKLVHVAGPVMIILGVLALFASGEEKVGEVIASALLAAGWGLVGLRLLGMSDEEWDGRAAPAAPEAPAAPPPAPPANV